jgi:hypothetical protein
LARLSTALLIGFLGYGRSLVLFVLAAISIALFAEASHTPMGTSTPSSATTTHTFRTFATGIHTSDMHHWP